MVHWLDVRLRSDDFFIIIVSKSKIIELSDTSIKTILVMMIEIDDRSTVQIISVFSGIKGNSEIFFFCLSKSSYFVIWNRIYVSSYRQRLLMVNNIDENTYAQNSVFFLSKFIFDSRISIFKLEYMFEFFVNNNRQLIT